METKTLSQYQKEINILADKFNFKWSNYAHYAHLVEEIGELGEALTVYEGERKEGSGQSALASHSNMKEELGDIFFALLVLASKVGVNMDDSMDYTFKRYLKKLRNLKTLTR